MDFDSQFSESKHSHREQVGAVGTELRRAPVSFQSDHVTKQERSLKSLRIREFEIFEHTWKWENVPGVAQDSKKCQILRTDLYLWNQVSLNPTASYVPTPRH